MTPTAVTYSLYPAGALFPDGTVRTRCKVFATPEGLALYWAVPADRDDDTPDWFSPIDYAHTMRPRTGYQARLGWEVHTDAGLVVVTAEGGCGCGWPLKRWNPSYARTRLAWPQTQSPTVTKAGSGARIPGARPKQSSPTVITPGR